MRRIVISRKEVWKWVPGWEGKYKVSNKGRVKRVACNVPCRGESKEHHTRRYPMRVLRLHGNDKHHPYLHASLCKRNRIKTIYVHILVCLAFYGPKPSPSHTVNHKDGVKTNNQLENLEWASKSENTRHAMANGLIVHRNGLFQKVCGK